VAYGTSIKTAGSLNGVTGGIVAVYDFRPRTKRIASVTRAFFCHTTKLAIENGRISFFLSQLHFELVKGLWIVELFSMVPFIQPWCFLLIPWEAVVLHC
jgi:hypothetical protein